MSSGVSLEFTYHTKGSPPPNKFISITSQGQSERHGGSAVVGSGSASGRILVPSQSSSASHFNRSSGFGMGTFGGNGPSTPVTNIENNGGIVAANTKSALGSTKVSTIIAAPAAAVTTTLIDDETEVESFDGAATPTTTQSQSQQYHTQPVSKLGNGTTKHISLSWRERLGPLKRTLSSTA